MLGFYGWQTHKIYVKFWSFDHFTQFAMCSLWFLALHHYIQCSKMPFVLSKMDRYISFSYAECNKVCNGANKAESGMTTRLCALHVSSHMLCLSNKTTRSNVQLHVCKMEAFFLRQWENETKRNAQKQQLAPSHMPIVSHWITHQQKKKCIFLLLLSLIQHHYGLSSLGQCILKSIIKWWKRFQLMHGENDQFIHLCWINLLTQRVSLASSLLCVCFCIAVNVFESSASFSI